MLNKIIAFSIRNKLIVGVCTILLVIYGVYQFTRLPIDAVPDITNNQVQVITSAPSFGATDIERLVTFPIEQANANIPGIQEIRSFSRFGLSIVTIVFDDNIDIYWARQQVSERLLKVREQIPAGIPMPEVGPLTTGLGEIYQYVLVPKKGYENRYTTTDLRTMQDWIVRRQLLGVKGVADVSSFGGNLKQYEIAIDPDRLQSLGVTVEDVYNAVQTNNQNTGGAYIEKGPVVLYIRTEGLLESMDEIRNIKVKMLDNGSPILVRDIAEVRIGSAIRYGAMHYNDKGEVCGAIVMMLKGGNSSEVIKHVKERIEQIQASLPEGVLIEPFLDRTKMVNNAIGTVRNNLVEGALIVVLVLVLLLGSARAGFIVASVIPLSLLFAVIMMNLFGVSGNLMSLGALDFGLIVDGAVIIVEAILHGLHKRHGQGNGVIPDAARMDREVQLSAGRMMNSAVFGQAIILIVYLPIFTLQGIEGKMFKPMAETVAFSLLGAFILSLTYVPVMSSLILSKKIKSGPNLSSRIMEWLGKHYRIMLDKAITRPVAVMYPVFVLLLGAVFIATRLGGEFIPTLEEGDFALETRVLPGSNLNVSIETARQASSILLKEFPEVEKVVAKIGSGEVPTDPMPIDAQDLMVILKDKREWKSASSFQELQDKMSKKLENVPGVNFGFMYPVQMRFNELMTGAKQDVVCKIFGENLDTLEKYADELGQICTSVKGAEDIYVEPVTGIPQIVVNYNWEQIAQYGLNVANVNRVINTAFAGESAGLVYEGEKRFDLVVRMQQEQRKDLEDVRNLLIPTSKGLSVPLHQLADISIKDGPNQVQREDAKRRIIVGFNVRGRDVQSIVEELREKAGKLGLPSGYYVTYGGAFQNLEAAKKRLSFAVPLALGLIFLLLYLAFYSVRRGLLIFSAIPLSAVGGIAALWLRGLPFSISAGVGFIALFGVSVLNGIVLIAEFRRLESSGLSDVLDIVHKGTAVRLRPVLITALVASLGFLPMALSTGAGAEVQRPLATVVIGGLLTATLLTLFVLPLLYIKFIRKKNMTINFRHAGILILLALPFGDLAAQQRITLQAAIDSSMANNISLGNDRLQISYSEFVGKTAFSIPQTVLFTEAGQINSIYFDNRFGISQSLNFPTVYTRRKEMLGQALLASKKNYDVSALELKRQMYLAYYHLLYLREKENILLQNDSIYLEFIRKASKRFEAGESNLLEKGTAEIQRSLVAIQLQQLREDKTISLLQLQWLMHTRHYYMPAEDSLLLGLPTIDSSQVAAHPQLQYLVQNKALTEAQTLLERARLMPDISVGYATMTMRGYGSDNNLYGLNSRFQSFSVGVGVPVFSGAQHNTIRASQIQERIAEGQYKAAELGLYMQWEQAVSTYRKYRQTVAYYESGGLQNVDLVQQAADSQFSKGAINYLNWVQLINQVLEVRSAYLDALDAQNTAVIQLNYLMGK